MALKAEDIERHIEQIRDERRESANTAKRVGGTMMEIFKYVARLFEEEVQNKYLRKDIEDTAQEVETFLKGIKVDELFSWDKDGNIVVNQAVFNSFLSSPKFVSGFLEGLGWRLSPETVVNAAGVQEQRYTLEIDNIIVRGILRVFEMVISQLLGENDNRIFTAMLEVDHYDAETGKVYLDTMEGRYYNPFRKDDIIMVQQYNGMPSEENDYYVTKRYELVVTEVGSEGEGENMLAWVKFKNFTSSMENATPENLIKKKDTFVRVDNLTDSERKGIITIMTVGKDTPYEDIIYGLKTDPDNALKGRLGNLKGIIHPLFGALQGFGELLMNLYATGDLILRRTGENIDTKFQVLENMFSTNYTKTEYELTDEDNYLHNGQFLTKYSDSDDAELIDGWKIDSDDDTAFWIDESGMPVLVNDNVAVGGNRRAVIERKDGRQLLRLTNIGITQANSLIKQPTTHKEYVQPSGSAKTDTDEEGNTSDNGLKTATDGSSKDIQDKLYVTMRIYALTQGTLSIGFTGCTDKEGLTNELSSRDQSISYSGKWQTVTFNGVWNGTGDFVIRYTGDCRIAFVAITDTALANLSKTVSTSIEQTAEAIKLLGYNDDQLHGQYTSLGIELNAKDRLIRQWVTSNYTSMEAAEKQVETLKGLISSGDSETAANAATLVQQQAGRIDVLAGRFDDYGSLKELSNYTQTTDLISTYITKADSESQLTAQVDTLKGIINDESSSLKGLISDGDKANADNLATYQEQTDSRISAIAGRWTKKDDGTYTLTELSNYTLSADLASTYISKADSEKNIKEQVDVLNRSIDNVQSEAESARSAADDAQSTADSAYSTANSAYSTAFNTATIVNQNSGSWSLAAGAFTTDSYGNTILSSLGGSLVTSKASEYFNKYISLDSSGNVTNIDTSGLVLTGDTAYLNSYAEDADGNRLSEAHMGTYVTKDSNGVIQSGVSINADQVNIDANHRMEISVAGALVINTDNFILDESGNATLNGTFTTGTGNGKIEISASNGVGTINAGGWVDMGYNSQVSRSFGSLITRNLPDYGGHLIITSNGTKDYFGQNTTQYTTRITGLSMQTNYLFAESVWAGSLVLGTPLSSSTVDSFLQSYIDNNRISVLIMTNSATVTVPLPNSPAKGQIFIVIQRGSGTIKFSCSNYRIWSNGIKSDPDSATVGQWNFFVFDGTYWTAAMTNQHL